MAGISWKERGFVFLLILEKVYICRCNNLEKVEISGFDNLDFVHYDEKKDI